MLKFSSSNIKSDSRALIRQGVWAASLCFLMQSGCIAAGSGGYDLGQAATGFGQDNVSNSGRTNVQFSDFGYGTKFETPNLNPQYDGSVPIDKLPINQVNNVDGMQINSVTAQDVYHQSGNQSGTSYYQAPRLDPNQPGRNVNPYYAPGTQGARTSLPPVTTGLQAQFLPNAMTPIAPSQFSFGFTGSPLNQAYRGSYANPQNPLPGFGGGFLWQNSLPATSLGSVDLNVVGK